MRNDIHRPGAINPSDYAFVAYGVMKSEDMIGDISLVQVQRKLLAAHMERTGGKWSNHEHKGNCHVCGAHCVYTAIFYHAKTNAYIRVGLDCADKMDTGDAELFRKQVTKALQAKAGKRKAEAFLKEQGLERAWEIGNRTDKTLTEEFTITDICHKLVKYGSISEKQVAFIRTLLARIDGMAQREADKAAAYEAAGNAPVTEDRIEIVGTILSIKTENGYAYNQIIKKVLIQHADGWKVWGNLPSNLWECSKGDVVSFTASLTVSDKDPKFAFFKRPMKATVVKAAETAE